MLRYAPVAVVCKGVRTATTVAPVECAGRVRFETCSEREFVLLLILLRHATPYGQGIQTRSHGPVSLQAISQGMVTLRAAGLMGAPPILHGVAPVPGQRPWTW